MEYAILFLPLMGSLIGYVGRNLTKYFLRYVQVYLLASHHAFNNCFFNGIQNDIYGNYIILSGSVLEILKQTGQLILIH